MIKGGCKLKTKGKSYASWGYFNLGKYALGYLDVFFELKVHPM